MKKNKILVLTPRFPFPVVGGDRLRIYKICQELSKYYELTLLSLCEDQTELKYRVEEPIFTKIYRIFQPRLYSYFNVLKAIPTKKPLQIAYYYNEDFKLKVEKLIEEHDLTLSHLIRVGDYVKDKKGLHVLEMTDAISMNYERASNSPSLFSFKKIIYSFERSRLYNYEKAMVNHFSLISLISSVDKNYLYAEPTINNIVVSGNGVDVEKYPFIARKIDLSDTVNLIFIGNMDTLQNFDAVTWFAKNILPELQVIHTFNLKVVGKISEKNKCKLKKIPYINVVGMVDNISVNVIDGHVGICPMRIGAGVQNKILEYMALGLPTITSSVGFEGLGAIKEKEIIVADTVEEYKKALTLLLRDFGYYKKIAENGLDFVSNKFSWQSQLTNLVSGIGRLLEK